MVASHELRLAMRETAVTSQVVRHERASIKADIWSYGVLIWELISGQDITELQPLAIARQMQVCCPAMSHITCCMRAHQHRSAAATRLFCVSCHGTAIRARALYIPVVYATTPGCRGPSRVQL